MGISVVYIQLEIDDSAYFIDIASLGMSKNLPANFSPAKTNKNYDSKKLRGKRGVNPVTVETHERKKDTVDPYDTIPFFSGNPFVEKTHGILHIYKRNEQESEQPTSSKEQRSKVICMLAVPAVMSSHDLLQFLAPSGKGITLIRIIRDNSPNKYMVLVSFFEQEQADDFYNACNGKPFNSLEPDLCHLVYVAKIDTKKQSEGAGLPLEGHTELPTCPVCLERMDESVDGILTVLCNHSFHANCLNQWGDTSCPVCRYVQTPELTPEHKCFVCNKQEDLWICLICGNIGCGRYAEAHAVLHFKETQHTFSLEVGGQRVWDYAGDNYVHRLIQSKSDGKVVEFDNSRDIQNDEKLDGITLEYTYLLTNQLESQRLYFEDRVARVEKMAAAEVQKWESRVNEINQELERLKTELKKSTAEKTALDKKLQQTNAKLQKCQQEWKDEKLLNTVLREDQKNWTDHVKELEKNLEITKSTKDKEIEELKEQLRDLMFHFEAEAKLKDSATGSQPEATNQEILESRLVVGEAPAPKKQTRKKQK